MDLREILIGCVLVERTTSYISALIWIHDLFHRCFTMFYWHSLGGTAGDLEPSDGLSTSILTVVFKANMGQSVPLLCSYSTCSVVLEENVWDRVAQVFVSQMSVLSPSRLCQSTANVLTSSFPLATTTLLTEECCVLYAESPTLIPWLC